MTKENRSNGGKIRGGAEGSNLLDADPNPDKTREGLEVNSTQNQIGPEASFTFSQIEAGCQILREHGAAAIEAYNCGSHESYELDFLRRIAEAIGDQRVMR